MLNTNILATASQNQESKVADFSNLMNNANAKTQEVQTKFVDKAVKSNTSSINKLALSSKKQANSKTQEVDKNASKQTQINVEKNNRDLKQQNQIQNTSRAEIKNNQEAKKESKLIDTNNVEVKQTTKTKKEDKSNLSDINNSSFVEPSPAFSSTESKEDIAQDANIEKIPTLLAITQDANLEQSQIAKDEINKILSEVENSSDLISAIEEISQFIGDYDDLSQDFKDQLDETLNGLKDLVESMDTENKINFENLANKLSQALTNDIDTELEINNNEKLIDTNKVVNQSDVALKADDFDVLTKIEDELDKLALQENNKINSELNELRETLKNIEESLVSSKENDSVEKIDINKNEINEKLNEILNKIQNIQDLKETDLNKVSQELKDIFTKEDIDVSNQTNVITKADFVKTESKISDSVDKLFDKIDADKISKLQKVDKNTMNEIIDTLSELNQTQEIDDETINEDISKLVDEIKNNEDLAQNPIKLAQNIQTLQEEVQQLLNNNKNNIENEDENLSDVNLISEDNSIDLSEIFKNLNSSNDNEFKDSNQDIKLVDNSKEVDENFDLNIDDIDFGNKVELETQNKTLDTQKIDVKNLEDSLKKAIQTQKLLDEMMISSKTSASSQSGALSVADEVAKLALEEVGSLSGNSNLQGSVLYDSASGQGALIKNAAQMFRGAHNAQNIAQNPNLDFSTNDIFNQIGDKLQQLKNGAEQKLTMVLRPNDLGRLSIELTSSKIGLTTSIMAQNEDVRAYIEENIDTLRQQLTDAGINVNNIQIKTAGQEGSTNYDGNQNFHHQQENNDNLNQQNNRQQHNKENKDRQDTLASMSNYDLHFAKDFSSILNKSISYNLN